MKNRTIDMTGAHQGSTHYKIVVVDDATYCDFYKVEGENIYSWWDRKQRWESTNVPKLEDLSLIASAWNGEGAPCVGTVCERRTIADGDGRYEQVIIIAHTSKGFPVWENTDAMFAGISKEAMFSNGVPAFRPIRTPEQIVTEEREKVIEQAMQMINATTMVPGDQARQNIARHVVEAMIKDGYRKFEITDDSDPA